MKEDKSFLKIGDGKDWSFLNGPWADGPEGELRPPDGTDVEYLAVRHGETYGDFTARFRFKFRSPGGGARFLFRVQDSRRFYALDVPFCGQQSRSRHFWAGMVLADGTPLQRYLDFGLVPGLCARVKHWYEARVEARGPRLRAWIEDITVADAEDSTYTSGRLGLGSISVPYVEPAHFAGLEVAGTPSQGGVWPGLAAPRPHWITPCPEADPKTFQSYANLIQSKSGAITLFLTYGNPNSVETRRAVYLRSTDAGRSWSKPEPATLQQGLGANFTRRDGTWVCVFPKHRSFKASLCSYESDDEGRTWTGPLPVDFEGEWPKEWEAVSMWRPVRMHDGAVVLPVIAKLIQTQTPSLITFCACFVLRSEDDGRTWSAPVLCDSNHMKPGEALTPTIGGGLVYAARYYEVGLAEARDNVLLGIGRPERDPYMWEIRSNDGGRTWEPGALGHFPGYCPSLTRTRSGALVATTRFPYFSAHLSRDGGRTWGLPVIVDYATWANQQALEAEPDVVLVTYMGNILKPGQADSRIARLRVTPEGLRLDNRA